MSHNVTVTGLQLSDCEALVVATLLLLLLLLLLLPVTSVQNHHLRHEIPGRQSLRRWSLICTVDSWTAVIPFQTAIPTPTRRARTVTTLNRFRLCLPFTSCEMIAACKMRLTKQKSLETCNER